MKGVGEYPEPERTRRRLGKGKGNQRRRQMTGGGEEVKKSKEKDKEKGNERMAGTERNGTRKSSKWKTRQSADENWTDGRTDRAEAVRISLSSLVLKEEEEGNVKGAAVARSV